MTQFPAAEGEKALLDDVLAALDALDQPLEPALESALDHAETLRAQLDRPVRIAVTGKRGAGKSSLVNLLTGAELIPAGKDDAAPLPAILVRHSETEKTIAGWWDRPEKTFEGLDLATALAEKPDVVSFELDCDVLRDLWLVDVSGLEEEDYGNQARFALANLADVLIWCSDARNAATQEERRLWQQLPPHLRRYSLLVLTHPDRLDGDRAEAAEARLTPERVGHFRDIAPVSIPAAWRAFTGEADAPDTLWRESGAAHLVEAVMDTALANRNDQLERIRRAIRKYVGPAQERLAELAPSAPARDEAESPPPEAPTHAPAEEPTEAPLSAVERWLPVMEQLLAAIRSGEITDNGQFIESAQSAVAEFLEILSVPGMLPPDADWVIEEFERADNLLVLLQYESADHVGADAAKILLQLSDTLSWAAGDAGTSR